MEPKHAKAIDDLTERLRTAVGLVPRGFGTTNEITDLLRDALTRIEQLEAQRAED